MKIPLRQRTKIELENVFFIELIFYQKVIINMETFQINLQVFYLDTRLVG